MGVRLAALHRDVIGAQGGEGGQGVGGRRSRKETESLLTCIAT